MKEGAVEFKHKGPPFIQVGIWFYKLTYAFDDKWDAYIILSEF